MVLSRHNRELALLFPIAKSFLYNPDNFRFINLLHSRLYKILLNDNWCISKLLTVPLSKRRPEELIVPHGLKNRRVLV